MIPPPGAHMPGERALVQALRDLLYSGTPAQTASEIPFGDDMAQICAQPMLLATVDTVMDGVDFDTRIHPWQLIGRKALAVNLSDCAAMAVRPVAALCSVALPRDLPPGSFLDLHRGIADLGHEFGCAIVGGDTNSWTHPAVISITVFATPWDDVSPVRRNGARPGDLLWVSGPLGGSILGRHLTFEPRVTLAAELARYLHPTAMMDISDGLAIDLGRLLEASGCGAELVATELDCALHADAHTLAAQDHRTPREHALHDGEDFELLLALPPTADSDSCRALGLLPIGRCVTGKGIQLIEHDGRATPVAEMGWEHFR
ncbi:MAG: thiamine-phosphate kinase [Phycisphaerales bacterium]|nr:thiamine-phosphate kinase [Phycisphaerales bacterium]